MPQERRSRYLEAQAWTDAKAAKMLGSLVLGGVACLGDYSGSAIMTSSAAHTGSGASASSGAGAGSGGGEDGGDGSVEDVGVIVSGGRLGGVVSQSGWGVEGCGEE
jgi:hypothetical protein